jgi:predicted CXXCH cytochrome family protein
MKTFLKLTAFSTLALAAGMANAGIANTPHNLGSGGTGPNHITGTATAEICVFCHTPHGSDTSAPAPLWNKQLPTATTYPTYESVNSSTMNARFADDGTSGTVSIGSVSIACLSCHDGTQAMDNVINAPGSGGYDATGGGANGRTGAAWAWTTVRTDAEGVMTSLASGNVANLGTDLSNDHPIGIQYCGGGPTVAAPGTACNDTDFNAPVNGVLGGGTKLWVDTNANGTREKVDIILYNRNFPVDGEGPSVECASCHDPHVERKNSNEVSFLRVSQANSGLCLACHNK